MRHGVSELRERVGPVDGGGRVEAGVLETDLQYPHASRVPIHKEQLLLRHVFPFSVLPDCERNALGRYCGSHRGALSACSAFMEVFTGTTGRLCRHLAFFACLSRGSDLRTRSPSWPRSAISAARDVCAAARHEHPSSTPARAEAPRRLARWCRRSPASGRLSQTSPLRSATRTTAAQARPAE